MDAEHAALAEALEHGDDLADLAIDDAGPDGGDDADRIDAADMRQLHLALRLLAGAYRDIEHAIDRAGMDFERDLARARHRLR